MTGSDPVQMDKSCIKCSNNVFYKSNLLFRCSMCDKEFTYEELEAFSKAKKPKRVLEIIANNIDEGFQDQHGRFFARVMVQDPTDHYELPSLDSNDFKFWITNLYDKLEKDVLGKDTKSAAIDALKARIYSSKATNTTHLRAFHDVSRQELSYDLVDNHWRVVVINQTGWRIVDGKDTYFYFVREKHMQAQVLPSKEPDPTSLDQLASLFHIKDANSRLLFKVYFVSLFVPGFPHPLLVVHGDHGASKSWLLRMIKDIIDPSSVPLLKMPKDRKDLMLTMLRNYLICFDNISNLSKEESDDLCRAVTGDGHLARELYENDQVKTYAFMRNVALNGINNPAFSPDLLDRVLSIELERIPISSRLREVELRTKIDALKPSVLGYVFNTLSKSFATVNDLKVQLIHRLADFLQWGEAISQAMGEEPGEFLKAYHENTKKQVETTVESNPIAIWILKFMTTGEMKEKNEYVGTAEDLRGKLQIIAAELQHDLKFFPKSASKLSKRIGEIKATLLEFGIEIKRGEKTGGIRRLTIRKLNGNNLDGYLDRTTDVIVSTESERSSH